MNEGKITLDEILEEFKKEVNFYTLSNVDGGKRSNDLTSGLGIYIESNTDGLVDYLMVNHKSVDITWENIEKIKKMLKKKDHQEELTSTFTYDDILAAMPENISFEPTGAPMFNPSNEQVVSSDRKIFIMYNIQTRNIIGVTINGKSYSDVLNSKYEILKTIRASYDTSFTYNPRKMF